MASSWVLGGMLVGVLMTLGWAARRWPRLTERRRVRLVLLGAVVHSGLTGILVWQAERAQSVIHPDGATRAALAGLAALALAGGVAVLRPPGDPDLRPVSVASARVEWRGSGARQH